MAIFDKIMIINFAIFINAILSLAIQMKFHTENKEYIVTKVNGIMRMFIPIIIVAGILYIVATLH